MRTQDLEQKKILIVEDEPDIRDILRNFLGDIGIHLVFEAATGFEALKFIDNERNTDLVICDWNMPGMSGHSVYRQLQTTHPDLPFIMITSRNDYESVQIAKAAGVTNYLAKPLSLEHLKKKVLKALKH